MNLDIDLLINTLNNFKSTIESLKPAIDNLKSAIDSLKPAIDNLKPVSSNFKNYLFPIITAFFSSILGAGVAYLTFRHQERIKIEKDKIYAANKWTLIALDALSSLVAIKENYLGELTDHPIQRALKIPIIIGVPKPINEELYSLSFIIPKEDDKKKFDTKWNQIPLILGVINNYNLLINLWEKRNLLERPVKAKIIQKSSNKGYADIDVNQIDQIIEQVGILDLLSFIDLTEAVIAYTDAIIIELNDFLLSFPLLVKSLIRKNIQKKYGPIASYDNTNLLKMINKSPEVNHSILSDLFGRSSEEIKKSYQIRRE